METTNGRFSFGLVETFSDKGLPTGAVSCAGSRLGTSRALHGHLEG